MSKLIPTQADTQLGEYVAPSASAAAWMAGEDLEPPVGNSGFNWRRIVSALLRYKMLVILVTAVGAVSGFVATRFVTKQYEATATIWVETVSRAEAARGPIRAEELLPATSWIELLKSHVVLGPVVQELRLYLTPKSPADSVLFATFSVQGEYTPGAYRLTVDETGRRFELATQTGTVLQRGSIDEPVGAELGFDWVLPADRVAPGMRVEFTVRSVREAAQRFANALSGSFRDRNTNFLNVSLSGTDPEWLARTLNIVVDRFVEVATDLKRRTLDERAEILAEQLRMQAEELSAAERALESFRVQTITLPSEAAVPLPAGLEVTRNPVLGDYFDKKVELEQVRRDRAAIQRALAQRDESGIAVAALEVINAVQRSSELVRALHELTEQRAELRALRHQYTDEHPSVKRVLARIETLERSTIPQLASALIAELEAREADLNGMIGAASSELQQIPPRAIEEARLQRHVEIQSNLYMNLRARYEEARLAAESSIPDLSILDYASPPRRPSQDPAPVVFLLATLGSFGLALLGAVLLDRVDPRFRYPEQITNDLGLPILGAVPHVRGRNGRRSLENAAELVEAFRSIRLNIMHAAGTSGGTLVLTVSSPESGDGKSFVSSNLALAFAEQGQRTLLIDGDIRRGTLHRLLGCERKPGLTDYLAGKVGREAIVKPTAYPGLHLIPSGTRMQSGPELLSTQRMRDLVHDLRGLYTVIIMDSAPLGAGVDPYVLGTVSGNLMLVLRVGATNRGFAEAKIDLLGRLPIRTLGAVLNDVAAGGAYYTYYYQSYSYLPGYEAAEEELVESGAQARVLPGA